MILKHSISNAKNFFKRTMESFKSLLGGRYQKLPEAPSSCYPFSCPEGKHRRRYSSSSFRDLENFYKEYANQLENSSKRKPSAKREENSYSGSLMQFPKPSPVKETEKIKRNVYKAKEVKPISARGNIRNRTKERKIQMTQKMKELEMMDVGNVEHSLDVEEVLHYYSRLISPAYLDIVDKFFMDMCSEIFGPLSSAHFVNCSWERLR